MLGCSTVCPNCQHEFTCCRPRPCCNNSINARRSLHVLSGGGMVAALTAPTSPCHSPQVSPSAPLAFVLPPSYPQIQSPPTDARPEIELQRLADTVRALRLSGWSVSTYICYNMKFVDFLGLTQFLLLQVLRRYLISKDP